MVSVVHVAAHLRPMTDLETYTRLYSKREAMTLQFFAHTSVTIVRGSSIIPQTQDQQSPQFSNREDDDNRKHGARRR